MKSYNRFFPNLHAPILLILLAGLLAAGPARGNPPGGGTGTGPAVTLVNNGNGTVTMANGILSLVISTGNANITQIYYTYNNSGTLVTNQMLSGGYDGGKFYWENAGFGSGTFTYSEVASTGDYCEIDLLSTSSANGVMDVHFSMLRGSPGFYVTPIWSHRAGDGVMTFTEGRDNIYVGSIFNWMSVSPQHDFETGVNQPLTPAFISPQEDELVTGGPMEGMYFDKYKYGMDFGGQNGGERVWGWSSVSDAAAGFTGQNVGIWHVLASAEVYNGGPLKTELMEGEAAYSLNMLNGSHYGLGQSFGLASGEVWSKTYGPYFIYFNILTNTVTDPVQASRALLADAQAQGVAEQSAWPYTWFTNANYVSAPGRGTLTGQMVIADSGNPNASASNLWVGVVQEPAVSDGVYDFQEWCKAYQFWTKTGANGSFSITNIIPGANYTLYAFGPGAAGTFMSQNQTGGNPPWLFNLPATPFSVTIAGNATNSLGAVTWTPTRVGPTVFEIGYPDRTSGKFRHGDDWFVGDVGPLPTAPSPIWTKFLDYPFDYPNGLTYMVGQNRWGADWNFLLPEVIDGAGNYDSASETILFNLATAPAGTNTASLYLAFAGAYSGPTIVSVNGNNLGTASGVTATPVTPLTSTGFSPAMDDSDVSVREGNHGAFSDERITFPASLLTAGTNAININMRRSGSSESFIMYDYLRLEMPGYVPPPPASVAAYAGNNAVLLSWPVTPGALGYNVLRSTTSGSGYAPLTNGVAGPVCGSGPANATYLDSTAANGSTYYYEVQSVNPAGVSSNSPASSVAAPSAGLAATAPVAPGGLAATTNTVVTLTWASSPGANYYTVWRGTVVNLPTGYVPFYITLSNTTTNNTYTDTAVTLGSTYSYYVTATSAGGTSAASAAVTAKPVPPPPAGPPGGVHLTDTVTSTNQSAYLTWAPVNGAVGYILFRSTSASGPFSFPANYVMSMTTTNYTDGNLALNTPYYYEVQAMNAGGVSAGSAIVSTRLAAPASLTAYPGSNQITLVWTASAGATNYVLMRGTSSGNETTTVTSTTNTTFLDTNVLNGLTYYYVVTARGVGGASPNSPEASATPFVGTAGVYYWTNTITAGAQSWNVNANWTNGTVFPNVFQAAAVVNAAIGAGQTIDLNQAITVGSLSLGSAGGAYTLAGNGGTLTFDNTPGQAALVELAAGSGDTISAPMTVNGGLVIVNASTNPLTLAGNLAGAASGLTVSGSVTFTGTNTYTGGTVLNGGSLVFSAGSTIPAGGTLTLNSTGSVTVVTASPLPNVLVNGVYSVTGNGNSGTAISKLNDAGSLTLYVSGGSEVFDLTGAMTGAGTLVLGGSPMTLRFNGTAGDGSAVFNLGTNAAVANVRATGTTAIALGGLTGGAGTQLQGDNSGGANLTYTIGGANATTEFDGVIKDGYNGTVTATVALSKTGSGALILTGMNTYSGGTTINGGTLVINNSTGSGTGAGAVIAASGGTLGGAGIITGAVSVNSGGALAPGNPLGTLTLSNNLTLATGGTALFQIQHSPLTNSAVMVSGTLTEGGTLLVTNSGGAALAAGDSFQLFTAGSYAGAFASLVLPVLPAGLVWNTNALAAGALSVGAAPPTPPITWLGSQSDAWNDTAYNWIASGAYAFYADGDYVVFNDSSYNYTVIISGSVAPGGVTFANATASYTLSATGGGLTGTAGLVKTNAGTLSLAGANSYTGGTLVSGGTLLVNNASGSGTGSGAVSVAGGTLGGTGGIAGAVTVNAGGALAPGNPLGMLTVSNNLTLTAGGTALFQVQHSPLTNTAVTVSGTLTEGGALSVTNTGGMALAKGDSFKLFNGGKYAGAFASLVLPPLPPGLIWSTNTLNTTGTLTVAATDPVIGSVSISPGGLVFEGSAGTADASFYLLGATNLSTPMANWTRLLTNQFDNNGNFEFTNAWPTNAAQNFFRLQVP
jgi:rhamnogalacturonan endolyase